MLKDGVCRVQPGYYTKTIEYEDTNYAVASAETQAAIFDGYCAFLNFFDNTLPCQMSFVNHRSRPENRYAVNIPQRRDSYDGIRDEFRAMLENQIARSNNGITRSKYLTFGVHADTPETARPRLERIEADIIGNFKKLGVQSRALNGRERLEVLHGQLHPGGNVPFRFSWETLVQTGMSTKDFIAPSGFDFRQSRVFRVGGTWGAASYMQIMASELSDRLLRELFEMDAEMTITMHIQAVDQTKAIKTVKTKLTDIDKMKMDEQKKAVRAGYDMDILPPDLVTFSKDAAALLQDLQSRNERMFLLTFLVVNTAPTRQQLENDIFTAAGIAQQHNCLLKRLDFQQEQGYMSSLPLGYNGIEIQRGMTTSSTAIFVPFMTRELRMTGESLYYGMNALSHNIIMANRKKLKSANGLYLGSTGSGKSFAAKRELINVFLSTKDRIIIVDPMGEYAPLVRRLGGQVIKISPDSTLKHFINPMDIQMSMADEESSLSMKADFLLSLCELILGGKDGLQPVERTVIDRCVRMVYREIALGISGKMPLLEDLYKLLCEQPEPEAKRIATALELYCTGSLNLFNNHTNVSLDKRVVCIVLKGMGENLRKIAMHITNELVTQAVNSNFTAGRATWCYFDEFHILLQDALSAGYFVRVWKMLRKKGCVPSALTQNVKDLLASREIENILENSDFMILLAQAAGDRAILAKQLGISEHQLSYISHSHPGEGLLFYGSTTIPFIDRFPPGEIYDLLTTRPEDIAKEARNE
ncbi:MAG TPA: conjugal transfer protein TraE [Ruminococcaceae bacterium]|nr:conjugal transfer protein TraE [Oscillospiraceae bacterium]